MVKVLKKGVGPDWWIEEPLTEQEQRMKADKEAKRALKMIDSNIEPCMQMWREAIANAPVPPVTRAERAAYNKEYPPRNNIPVFAGRVEARNASDLARPVQHQAHHVLWWRTAST